MIAATFNVMHVPRYRCLVYESTLEELRDSVMEMMQGCDLVCDVQGMVLPIRIVRVLSIDVDVNITRTRKARHYAIHVEVETDLNVDGCSLAYGSCYIRGEPEGRQGFLIRPPEEDLQYKWALRPC